MGKKSSGRKAAKKNIEQKARRELARAQLKFHIAQEKQVQARARGKGEVEQARLKAARWLAKSAQTVERCSEDVAAAEARLREIMRDGDRRPVEGMQPDEPRVRRVGSNGATDLMETFGDEQAPGAHDAEVLAADGSGEQR